MATERFILIQNGNDFTVRDIVKEKHMGVFEFKEDEFPVYFCFHKIIDLLNEQHEEIQQLQRHVDVMRSGALTDDKRIKELYKENEQLKSELNGMELLLKSYRKTIEHDAELLADATRNGYLPPLEDWKGDV